MMIITDDDNCHDDDDDDMFCCDFQTQRAGAKFVSTLVQISFHYE